MGAMARNWVAKEGTKAVTSGTVPDVANERLGKIVKLVLDMNNVLQWRFKSLYGFANEILDALKGIEQEMKGVVELSE